MKKGELQTTEGGLPSDRVLHADALEDTEKFRRFRERMAARAVDEGMSNAQAERLFGVTQRPEPEHKRLTKTELVRTVAVNTGLPTQLTKAAIEQLLGEITRALKEGDEVRLVGFGTFAVRQRPAHVAVNPVTGQKMTVPPARHPRFKAGKSLKEALR